MKKILTLLILFATNLNCFYADTEKYQETISKEEVETKLTKYLQYNNQDNNQQNDTQNGQCDSTRQNSNLSDFYQITNYGLEIFGSKEEKERKNPEFVLRFGSNQKPNNKLFEPDLSSSKPFNKLRVAIDPGHLGGIMSKVEERYIDLKLEHEGKSLHVQFDEGTLASQTAKALKALLTELGAEVFITREEPGKAVYNLSFEEWCEKEFGIKTEQDWLCDEIHKKILFYLSNAKLSPSSKEELAERISSINNSPVNKSQVNQNQVNQSPANQSQVNQNQANQNQVNQNQANQNQVNQSQVNKSPDSGKENQDSSNLSQKVWKIKRALFRLGYNILDLLARAEKINAFNPDLTIIIHYNASGGSSDIAKGNYCLTFVPGHFSDNGLTQEIDRSEFVRLLVSDDIEKSIQLSREIAKTMATVLNTPLMKSPAYLSDTCHYVEDGIYCRNLYLTRLVHSPLCYGETLIQNYPPESLRLFTKDKEGGKEFDGQLISSRVLQVALTYFKGICNYFNVSSI